jgi:hypothetical protein
VSVDGDTALVGASGDDDAGFSSGSAYVFTRSGTAWTQQAKLTAADAASGDQFGYAVSVDGDTALVGARFDDDAGSFSGSAYVFTRSGTVWTQQAKLTAADAAGGDEFGWSVSVDGDTALVGAYLDDDGGTDSGSAYVFEDVPMPPTITSAVPPDGTVGTAYSHQFTATGTTPITYAITAGALPDGLTLTGDTISGTPTAGGTFSGIEVTATNVHGTDTQTFDITIATPPTITSAAPPDGTVGTAYSHQFTATGTTPITWEITAGPLPDGLTLTGDTISGTPTADGTFSGIEVTATNAAGTDTQTFDITIAAPPTITSAVPPDGTVGTAYSHQFTATGDTPISWSITTGTLPDGLTLTGDTISGTPTAGGTFSGIEVTATTPPARIRRPSTSPSPRRRVSPAVRPPMAY